MFRRVILLGFALASLTPAIAAPPTWWGARAAVDANPPNDDSAVNQGQLKQFTQKAVQELNARIPGGAGPELNGLVNGWVQAYQAGGYNATNPLPADFDAMNAGQLKWIASKVHARLVFAKYEDALPAWLVQNAAIDKQLVNLGQLKTVFNFDLTVPTGELPLWWQKFYFNGQTGIDPNDDTDEDGLSNAEEFTLGSNPSTPDTDGDGIPDKVEVTNGTNSTLADTDGDLINDGLDADPNEILVNWAPAQESSYVLIDVDAPAEAGNPQDLNDKGEVLFDYGIWSGGDWIPKTPAVITGVYPDSVNTAYPDGIPYEIVPSAWSFFNSDRKLLQMARIHPTDGPGVDSSAPCPLFWPEGQSSPSIIYETANRWGDPLWNAWTLGVSNSGDMALRVRPLVISSGPSVPVEHIERFDTNGATAGVMDGADGYHPTGNYSFGSMSRSGWVVANLYRQATQTQTGGYKLGLWDSANNLIPLPTEAGGTAYPTIVTDLPNNKVAVIAGQTSNNGSVGRVFLPDANGSYQYVQSLSTHHLQLMAGDGTGMTSDNMIWRNGKLIPLRDLCEDIRELLDGGWQIHPLKANKHGMYLILAEGPSGETITKLLVSVRFGLRNPQNAAIPPGLAQGWDDTGRDSKNRITPWTSCGVNRKDAQGNDSPNSIVNLTIPGCTQEMGNLLELAQEPAGGNIYVSLTDQTISGETTNFNIQGVLATPEGGCKISVRQKALTTSRSWPLNVHVFIPRIIEFQVYLASADATKPLSALPANLPSVAAIKQELEATYRNQANITFHELNANATVLNNLADVFVDASGSVVERIIPNSNPTKNYIDLLVEKPGPAKHLKIFIVKNVIDKNFIPNANPPNTESVVGLALPGASWAIVEAGQSMDVYSHETGHSLALTTKKGSDQTPHEELGVPTPYGVKPLMSHSVGGSRWIRRQDWKTANTQASGDRYGH